MRLACALFRVGCPCAPAYTIDITDSSRGGTHISRTYHTRAHAERPRSVHLTQKRYEKASRRVSGQAGEEQADAGDVDQGLAGDREALVILAEARSPQLSVGCLRPLGAGDVKRSSGGRHQQGGSRWHAHGPAAGHRRPRGAGGPSGWHPHLRRAAHQSDPAPGSGGSRTPCASHPARDP
jgi:hypothetical protein